MSKRIARKMLRRMETGEPVDVHIWAGLSYAKPARLAALAEQFGYDFQDITAWTQTGCTLSIRPDPRPEAQARAAENRARYPRAGKGGPLPPLATETVDVMKARMLWGLTRPQTRGELMGALVFAIVVLTLMEISVAVRFGSTGALVGGAVELALLAFIPALLSLNRRYHAKCTTVLENAGFIAVTGRDGRVRYELPAD
ncbi:hypothetical protein [Streptomyces roseicoloratus]|uniref:hypothetical protein n=1 Tax=Streptomyces roseicoloratus TaxID=2508722 RepID=UPI001009C122|nr:hypothetical protein [Streptomyces roseicoloratus]